MKNRARHNHSHPSGLRADCGVLVASLIALTAPMVLTIPTLAQEPMKFPSFNSVVAKPQGVPVEPGGDQAVTGPPPGAAAKPPTQAAKPKPKPKAVASIAKANDVALAKASEAKGLSIAVLVNDDPITGYEIEQRQRIMSLGANIGEKAQANFKAFPAGQQREYIVWITEAKQDATREKRIKTAVEWIAEGKIRNWKYVK